MSDQAGGLLSPFLRRQRVAMAKPYIQGRVWDFGCGTGYTAGLVAADKYLGTDSDQASLQIARSLHPQHTFVSSLPDQGQWDTILALAVMEHLDRPGEILQKFVSRLADGGRIVMTTPHPWSDKVHELGAKLGLFSRAAHEEHEHLFDRKAMVRLLATAGLGLIAYRPFLLGMNQLFVASKNDRQDKR